MLRSASRTAFLRVVCQEINSSYPRASENRPLLCRVNELLCKCGYFVFAAPSDASRILKTAPVFIDVYMYFFFFFVILALHIRDVLYKYRLQTFTYVFFVKRYKHLFSLAKFPEMHCFRDISFFNILILCVFLIFRIKIAV